MHPKYILARSRQGSDSEDHTPDAETGKLTRPKRFPKRKNSLMMIFQPPESPGMRSYGEPQSDFLYCCCCSFSEKKDEKKIFFAFRPWLQSDCRTRWCVTVLWNGFYGRIPSFATITFGIRRRVVILSGETSNSNFQFQLMPTITNFRTFYDAKTSSLFKVRVRPNKSRFQFCGLAARVPDRKPNLKNSGWSLVDRTKAERCNTASLHTQK